PLALPLPEAQSRFPLPLQLMHFHSGSLMYFLSGVLKVSESDRLTVQRKCPPSVREGRDGQDECGRVETAGSSRADRRRGADGEAGGRATGPVGAPGAADPQEGGQERNPGCGSRQPRAAAVESDYREHARADREAAPREVRGVQRPALSREADRGRRAGGIARERAAGVAGGRDSGGPQAAATAAS